MTGSQNTFGAGNDSITLVENLTGSRFNDVLLGNVGRNTLNGGLGNDTLNGSGGNDSLIGGLGDDIYFFGAAAEAEADSVTEARNGGLGTLRFSGLTTSVVLNLGTTDIQSVHANRTLKLNSGAVIENATGGSDDDTLVGNSLPNTLSGNAGNDILLGNTGDDELYGGAGRDISIGGPGIDRLLGGLDDDILVAGRTTNDALFNNLNDFRIESTSPETYAVRQVNLRTGVGASRVSLKARINVLNDRHAIDTLTGGSGTDWYFRAIDDVIMGFLSGEGQDLL